MIRKLFSTSSNTHHTVRGKEIFRIEALSDAVFAFSVSLLIMSLEVPGSFEELKHTILKFPPFFATVGLVFFFWFLQQKFFRNYGINNNTIVFLNLTLLAIILFYAFPLKYLFSLLLSWIFGKNYLAHEEGATVPFLTLENFNELIIFFSIGYAVIWLLFYLMYRQAHLQKKQLNLSQVESILLSGEMRDALVQIIIAITSLFFAVIHLPTISGICFLMIPLWLVVNNLWLRKKINSNKL
jgi:uncharacterized membrane protein